MPTQPLGLDRIHVRGPLRFLDNTQQRCFLPSRLFRDNVYLDRRLVPWWACWGVYHVDVGL